MNKRFEQVKEDISNKEEFNSNGTNILQKIESETKVQTSNLEIKKSKRLNHYQIYYEFDDVDNFGGCGAIVRICNIHNMDNLDHWHKMDLIKFEIDPKTNKPVGIITNMEYFSMILIENVIFDNSEIEDFFIDKKYKFSNKKKRR